MQLSPEERLRIYEEEKARIENEHKQRMNTGGSTTGLEPIVAGLLCYLGGWILFRTHQSRQDCRL